MIPQLYELGTSVAQSEQAPFTPPPPPHLPTYLPTQNDLSSYLGRLFTNLGAFLHKFSQFAFLGLRSTDLLADAGLCLNFFLFLLFKMRCLGRHSCSHARGCVFEATKFLLDVSLRPFQNFILSACRAIVLRFVLRKQ